MINAPLTFTCANCIHNKCLFLFLINAPFSPPISGPFPKLNRCPWFLCNLYIFFFKKNPFSYSDEFPFRPNYVPYFPENTAYACYRNIIMLNFYQIIKFKKTINYISLLYIIMSIIMPLLD